MDDKKRPVFHKANTIDNIFSSYFGFQAGQILIQGRNLKKHHAYVELSISESQEKHKTQIADDTENPKFDHEEFCTEVHDAPTTIVHIKVFNWKRLAMKNKPFGVVDIKCRDLVDGNIHESWYPLISEKKDKPVGDIYLRLQYSSALGRNFDYKLAKENSAKLMSILLHHDLVILSVLCKVYESEELSKTVIRLFYAEGQALRLLIQLIYRDLKNTRTEETLFRFDSMATKTTRNYFKMIAPDYLKKALGSVISDVLTNPHGYEVDPSKLKNHPNQNQNLDQNIKTLETTTQKFLDAVISSLENIPINMRKFFNLLRQLVKQCFPSSEMKAIGAFFFLRFMCPCIVSPEYFIADLTSDMIDPDARRALTLIAKIIQNIANESKAFKEDFMSPFDSFLAKNNPQMHSFYDKISVIPTKGPEDAWRPKFSEEDRHKSLSIILGQIGKNFANLEKQIEQDPRMKDANAVAQNKEHLQILRDILAQKQNM